VKYPWLQRWASLGHRVYPYPAFKVSAALDVGAWFIETHADDAEPHGWRPIHLLRPGVGLAWRWWNIPEPVITVSAECLTARIGGFDFQYRPLSSGAVHILTGADRVTT